MKIDFEYDITFETVEKMLNLTKEELSNFMTVFRFVVSEVENHHRSSDRNGYSIKRYITKYLADKTTKAEDINYFMTKLRIEKFIKSFGDRQMCKNIINNVIGDMHITTYAELWLYSSAQINLEQLSKFVDYLVANYDKKEIILYNLANLEELKKLNIIHETTLDTDVKKENILAAQNDDSKSSDSQKYECIWSGPNYEISFVNNRLNEIRLKDIATDLSILDKTIEKINLNAKKKALEKIYRAQKLMETKETLLSQYIGLYNIDETYYRDKFNSAMRPIMDEVVVAAARGKVEYGITDLEIDQYVKSRKKEEVKN